MLPAICVCSFELAGSFHSFGAWSKELDLPVIQLYNMPHRICTRLVVLFYPVFLSSTIDDCGWRQWTAPQRYRQCPWFASSVLNCIGQFADTVRCNDHVSSWIIGRNIPKFTIPLFQCEAYGMCPMHWEWYEWGFGIFRWGQDGIENATTNLRWDVEMYSISFMPNYWSVVYYEWTMKCEQWNIKWNVWFQQTESDRCRGIIPMRDLQILVNIENVEIEYGTIMY